MSASASTWRRLVATAILTALLGLSAKTVVGQQAVGGFVISGAAQQRISALETRFSGGVTLQRGNITVVADDVTFLVDQDLLVATGKVVFREGGNTINSESATFNANTQLGTFVRAYGVFAIKAVTPLYFYGETVEQTD